jgi:hypothetical protein
VYDDGTPDGRVPPGRATVQDGTPEIKQFTPRSAWHVACSTMARPQTVPLKEALSMTRSIFATSILASLALALSAGCASKSTATSTGSGSDAVDQGSDSNAAESDTETLSTSFIGGDGTTVSLASASELVEGEGTLAPANLGDGAKAFYRPAGCLVVTPNAAAKTAKYVFSDCTGPYGQVHITGEVDVTFSSSAPNQLTVTYAATGLQINRHVIDWTATANVTSSGLARDMIWDGKFNGTTARGRAFSRTNHKEYKWTQGQACLSVNGESDGTVTGHEIKTDVINFSICKGGCPDAGSEIKITDVSANRVYDVKYNAVDATYTGPEGRSINFTPLCSL